MTEELPFPKKFEKKEEKIEFYVVWPTELGETCRIFKTKERARSWKEENKVYGVIHTAELVD